MNQQESDAAPPKLRPPSVVQRVANLAIQFAGGAAIALSAATALAKRDRDDAKRNDDGEREGRSEERRDTRRAERSEETRVEKREDRRESREQDSSRDQQSRSATVDQEQRDRRENGGSNNDTDDDGGGNGRGNAGSGFFDSPLATKAQRRANDFDNNRDRDDEPDDDLVADRGGDSQIIETNSILVANGPDGLEVFTGNIEYFAPPTPTPTPFPTLTFPERDRLDVFGDRVIAAPTSTPADDGPTNEPAPPPASDGGNVTNGSRPSPTPSADGGDNTSDFLS